MKKQVTIIYTDELLPYCAAVINLNQALCETGNFDVKIVTYSPRWCRIRLSLNNIYYENRSWIIRKYVKFGRWSALLILRLLLKQRQPALSWKIIREMTSRNHHIVKAIDTALNRRIDWNSIIIAVDPAAGFAASLKTDSFIFLSLELYENDLLANLIPLEKIKLLIIQSEVRKNILFPSYRGHWSLLPNTPIFKEREIPQRRKGNLVFAGTALENFGFKDVLRFLRERQDFNLTHFGFCPESMKKIIHDEFGNLILERRVTLDSGYRSAEELLMDLSSFWIGLCFYRVDLVAPDLRSNYLTAPSGKLANYLAAGLPVICSDIPACEFVRDRNCGVLIPDVEVESIEHAIAEIEKSYDIMCKNSLQVAREMCFSRHIGAVIDCM